MLLRNPDHCVHFVVKIDVFNVFVDSSRGLIEKCNEISQGSGHFFPVCKSVQFE